MSWYLKYVCAQLQDFLQQKGLDPQSIQYVLSLNPEQQKFLSGFIAKNPNVSLEKLQQIMTSGKPKPLAETAKTLETTPEVLQQFLNECDKSGKYHKWIIRQLLNKDFRIEDRLRVQLALNAFNTVKARLTEKDINKYLTLNTLENAIDVFEGTGAKADGYLQYNPLSLPGVDLYRKLEDGSTVYKITDADSLAKLGIGTKWCTREDYPECMAKNYIRQHGSIFIMTKGGKPVIQFTPDLQQVMDVNDKEIGLPAEISNDKNLILKALPYNLFLLDNLSPKLIKDKQFITELVEVITNRYSESEDIFDHASSDLLNNKHFIQELANKGVEPENEFWKT